MDCPACKGVMVVAEYKRIEVDYCTKCSGVWFDAGELELLLESIALDGTGLTMAEIMALPAKKVAEKARPCPICHQKMRKVVIGSEPEVLIDICSQGDGIWFDGGELGQIIGQLKWKDTSGTGKHARVINFLGEVFEAKG